MLSGVSQTSCAVSSKSWLCVKSGCRMIRQVICRYASVFCTLSFAIRCCHGLPNSLEKEVFHFFAVSLVNWMSAFASLRWS